MYTKVERNLTVKASCTFFELERKNLCHGEAKMLVHRLKRIKNAYCNQQVIDKNYSNFEITKKWQLDLENYSHPLKIEIIKNV